MHTLTHNSRSTHGVISESHMRAHDRKGREGKGRESEGMGAHVETSHHVVTYVGASAQHGDAMMSIQPETIAEQALELVTIEGIDLDAEVPCNDKNPHGHPDHPHPADYLTDYRCAECGRSRSMAACRASWEQTLVVGIACLGCDAEYDVPALLDVFRIVEVLR